MAQPKSPLCEMKWSKVRHLRLGFVVYMTSVFRRARACVEDSSTAVSVSQSHLRHTYAEPELPHSN